MSFERGERVIYKMNYRLGVTYASLLLISSISSCLLFLIVASEAIKPNSDDGDRNENQFDENSNLKISGDFSGSTYLGPGSYEESDNGRSAWILAPGAPPPSSAMLSETASDEIEASSAMNRGASDIAVNKMNSGVTRRDDDGDKKEFGSLPNIVEEEEVISPLNPTVEREKSAGGNDDERKAQSSTANSDGDGGQSVVAEETLPDIPVNPAVITLNDKTPEMIFDGLPDDNDEDYDSADLNINHTDDDASFNVAAKNGFVVIADEKSIKKESILPQDVPPDESPPKIDDSGGGTNPATRQPNNEAKDSIPSYQEQAISIAGTAANIPVSSDDEAATASVTSTPEVNLTVEENPIPVFSEWAQKQMEEAEKKLEKEVVNSSTMKKNTVAGNKPQPMKLRAKNYASPDCGAKIIASNSDAQNTGALLSSNKDEYMLSPCTNRIWFVVELCEAIQAEKVELANFELFSSSPKNFSVAVSNRFPTREWSNVGRFVAEDQRNIQSFELYPQLFGKFVRVDIHSHYNSEHFCPISLFRVYGTSEFEAFETANRPADEIDEFQDDDDAAEAGVKNENSNLFKSASDAVMSIVKKAAEALVKTQSNKTETDVSNETATTSKLQASCLSLRQNFSCEKCDKAMVNRTNYLLSCKYNQLVSLLSIEPLRTQLIKSQICANRFNLDANENLACKQPNNSQRRQMVHERQSFLLSAFPTEYLAAFCHILSTEANSKRYSKYSSTRPGSDSAMNLTIDQKAAGNQFIAIEPPDPHAKPIGKQRKLPKLPTKVASSGDDKRKPSKRKQDENESHGDRDELNTVQPVEYNKTENQDDDPELSDQEEKSTGLPIDFASRQDQSAAEAAGTNEPGLPTVPDVNIFNLVDEEVPEAAGEVSSNEFQQEQPSNTDTNSERGGDLKQTKNEQSTENRETTPPTDIEPTAWDNIDQMLGDQVSSESVGNTDGMVPSFQQIPQRVHSESVFLRLSNRIKALERNMSLSGQYLEELSRRYKKQVEELQHSFAKTLASIDEQNRRALEKENILIAQNRNLNVQLNEISTRLHYWIIFGLCFFFILLLQTILLWLRSRRENIRILRKLERYTSNFRRSSTPRKASRRKSVEGVSGHPSPSHKVRRPSEEADRIGGSYKNLLIGGDEADDDIENIGGSEAFDTLTEIGRKNQKSRQRKISNGRRNGNSSTFDPKLLRQESAPGDFVRPNVAPSTASQDDDKMLLEDDYETYVPGTDLAYNEFMPDGPSGSQQIAASSSMNGKLQQNNSKASKKTTNKVRRLSSPGFLKSTFVRNSSANSRKTGHSPTGWEWYRLRKFDTKNSTPSPSTVDSTIVSSQDTRQKGLSKWTKKAKSESPDMSNKINGFGNGSSTPNSSLSEAIMFNHTGSDDSLRISDTSITTGSILSNNNRSNTSKKHGSFRRILKKVF